MSARHAAPAGARTPKRGNGEGTVVRRSDGRWEGRCTLPRGTGRQRISVYGRTREDVVKQLRARLSDRDRGRHVAPTRETIAAYLECWLNDERSNQRWKPTMFQSAESIIRVQLIPRIGRIGLSRLRSQQVQHMLTEMLDAGLSPKTVRNVHGVLHTALERAVEQDRIAENPASKPRVRLPRRTSREMTTLDADQVRAVLTAAREDELGALWILMLTTGARQGELLALRWRDVDLDASRMSIVANSVRLTARARTLLGVTSCEPQRGTPKTKRGTRLIEMPQLAVAALREHRRLTKVVELNGRVFNRPDGRALAVPTLYTRWHALLKRAGVPLVRPHDARHTVATLLLGEGENPKIVQELLGHATVAITMDVYSHVTPGMHRQAAQKLDALLSAQT